MTVTNRLDGLASGAALKVPCRVASTGALTLSGLQTVDGVALAAGDRVLVMNQADETENGIYVADTGDWDRAKDFDGNLDIVAGTLVTVRLGSTNASTMWKVDAATNDPLIVDTDDITFTAAGWQDAATTYWIQSGTGAVQRTVQDRLRDSVNVKDFGAVGDGVTDDTTAFQNALKSAGKYVEVPYTSGGYLITSQLIIGSATYGALGLIGTGGWPTIAFSGIGAATDCVDFGPTAVTPNAGMTLENIQFDFNTTGQDGVHIGGAVAPIIRNVRLVDAARDALAIKVAGFDYVEGATIEHLRVDNAGRHGWYNSLAGADGAYINELHVSHYEMRGCSKLTTGGAAIYWASTAGGGGSKFGSWLFEKLYLDCQWDGVAGHQPDLHAMHVASGNLEAPIFMGFSVESTGTANTGGNAIKCDAGGGNLTAIGGIYSGWGSGVSVPAAALDVLVRDSNGTEIKNGKLTSSNQGYEQANSGARGAAATFDLDVPFPGTLTTTTSEQRTFQVAITYNGLAASSYQITLYHISIIYNTGTAAWFRAAIAGSTGNQGGPWFTVNSVDPDPANNRVRINLTTAAGFPAGGGDNVIYATLNAEGGTKGG